MADSLHALIQAIASAQTEQEVRARFMDGISECFGVQRWGIYLGDRSDNSETQLVSYDVAGVTDAFVERYTRIGRSVDPVLHYVMTHHAPAHEELVLPAGTWRHSELYQRCCAEYDHAHIMTGPIVGDGRLVGTVHFARVGSTPAFTGKDLARLGALCAHLSACLAALRQQPSSMSVVKPDPLVQRLTPRELQIAQLVAQGLTNAEIGAALWITQNSVKQALKRMFRKLEVSARTAMVAKLRDLL